MIANFEAKKLAFGVKIKLKLTEFPSILGALPNIQLHALQIQRIEFIYKGLLGFGEMSGSQQFEFAVHFKKLF